jgi:tetratricopeptide (TPR) repeat protein
MLIIQKLKYIIVLLYLFPTVISIYGQGKHVEKKDIFNDAMYFYNRDDYAEALYNLKKLYRLDSTNASINYKIGYCYMQLPGEEHKAIPHLKKASKNISENYNEFSFKQKTAPLHTLYYLARAYRLIGKIDKSIAVLNNFMQSPYYNVKYNDEMVSRELLISKHAKILRDNPVQYKLTKLEKTINDSFSCHRPVVSGNDQHIVFIKKFKFYDAIMYSKKNNDKWSEAKNITPSIGSDGHMYPCALSYDGKELFLVKEMNSGNQDIFISKLEKGAWTKAIPFNDKINSLKNEAHACISHDGQTLYFTRSKGISKSQFDIYYTEKRNNGKWKRPRRLKQVINTEWNEATPFITNQGRMLFFSSKGHYNMGRYDIFFSVKNNRDRWSEPQNLGYPINTTKDNLFFVPVQNGNTGYISMKEKNSDHFNIYKIEMLFPPFLDNKTKQDK